MSQLCHHAFGYVFCPVGGLSLSQVTKPESWDARLVVATGMDSALLVKLASDWLVEHLAQAHCAQSSLLDKVSACQYLIPAQ